MPVVARNVSTALRRVCSGDDSKGWPFFVEERAEHTQRRLLAEGVHESRGEARQHVEVAARRLDKREEAGAIDALAAGENGLQVVDVGQHEVERLHLAVASRIQEVDTSNVVFPHEAHDVLAFYLLGCHLQLVYHGVGIEYQLVVVHGRWFLTIYM